MKLIKANKDQLNKVIIDVLKNNIAYNPKLNIPRFLNGFETLYKEQYKIKIPYKDQERFIYIGNTPSIVFKRVLRERDWNSELKDIITSFEMMDKL